MEVKLGATVMGTDGKLGEVTCFTYDVHTHGIDQLVVRHGTLLAKEHAIALRHVARADGDTVYTDLDRKSFEGQDEFSEYPNRPRESDPRDDVLLSPQSPQATNLGLGTYATDPLPDDRPPQTVQSEPDVVPEDNRIPTLRHGTAIYDRNAERIGELDHFSVDTESEKLIRVSMKRGSLFGQEVTLPPEWIDDVTLKGVALRVTKEDVRGLAKR